MGQLSVERQYTIRSVASEVQHCYHVTAQKLAKPYQLDWANSLQHFWESSTGTEIEFNFQILNTISFLSFQLSFIKVRIYWHRAAMESEQTWTTCFYVSDGDANFEFHLLIITIGWVNGTVQFILITYDRFFCF